MEGFKREMFPRYQFGDDFEIFDLKLNILVTENVTDKTRRVHLVDKNGKSRSVSKYKIFPNLLQIDGFIQLPFNNTYWLNESMEMFATTVYQFLNLIDGRYYTLRSAGTNSPGYISLRRVQHIWREAKSPQVGYKTLPNFSSYRIFPDGTLFSLLGYRFLDAHKVGKYLGLELVADDGSKQFWLIHRLVATAFIDKEREEQNVVNHIDGNPENNCVTNLEWVTQTENIRHAMAIGLIDNSNHKMSKRLTNVEDVALIRELSKQGKTAKEIQQIIPFEKSISAIRKIIQRQTFKMV